MSPEGLGYFFQPPKCVSLHFNGHRVVPTTKFSMSDGHIINTCTKFLRKTIGISPSATCKLASDNMKQQNLLYLKRIDDCSIRGEFKLWILKNFVSAVLHFHTAVERLSMSSLTFTQSLLTRSINHLYPLEIGSTSTVTTIYYSQGQELSGHL